MSILLVITLLMRVLSGRAGALGMLSQRFYVSITHPSSLHKDSGNSTVTPNAIYLGLLGLGSLHTIRTKSQIVCTGTAELDMSLPGSRHFPD